MKTWLIELGKKNKFDSMSPDITSIAEFSRVKNEKLDYRPDVIWKNKRTRGKVFFELAFTEDWKTVLGEVLLASQVENFEKIYIIRQSMNDNFWTKNVEPFLRALNELVLKKRYSPGVIIIEENCSIEELKETILSKLIEDKWFS